MKKILFALLAIALVGSASSCKKCGYCVDSSGNHSAATCSQSGLAAIGGDPYRQAKADCEAEIGSHWVVE